MKSFNIVLIVFLAICVQYSYGAYQTYGWGRNDMGQLGMGNKSVIYTPYPITYFNGILIREVLTAQTYIIFLCDNKTAYGSGFQYYGQFANGSTNSLTTSPVGCPSLNRSMDIVLPGTACNANYNTNLYGWGYLAGYVQAKTTGSFPKIQAALASYKFDGKVLSVHSVQDGTIVRLANNTVWAAGNNNDGRLGIGGGSTTIYNFVQVTFWIGTALLQFFSGQSAHACALSTSRSLYCWGRNDVGQLGVGDTNTYTSPTLVSFFDDNRLEVYKVSYGDSHTLVLTCGGRVFSFGGNVYAQLGQGISVNTPNPTPQEVTAGDPPNNNEWNGNIADIVTGINNNYVRTTDNRWYCWGASSQGGLGFNTPDSKRPKENTMLKSLNINRIKSSSQSYNFIGWYDDSVTNAKSSCPVLVNECTDHTANCHVNAECTDFERGYTCNCKQGFTGDGYTTGTGCTNENSCELTQLCDGNAICTDNPDGPVCSCGDGFEGTGILGDCHDINECAGTSPCATNAVCVNTVGSYSCQCQDGYYGDPYFDGCTVICDPGQYSYGNLCLQCPAGYYSNTSMATHCVPCPVGTYSDALGLNSSSGCMPCDIGGYAALGSKYCSLCIHGYTNDPTFPNADNSTCFACPLGTYGYYGKCYLCSSGAYSQIPTAKDCRQCPPGSYGDYDGSLDCEQCPAGTSSRGGTESCTQCLAGFYSQQGSKDCIKCPPGTSTNGQPGQGSCGHCTAGYFSGKAGTQNCFACPAGSYSGSAATGCTRCPPGTFSGSQASAQCTPCTGFTYSAGTAATKCIQCDAGSAPSDDGTSCNPCNAGYYLSTTTNKCEPCAPGTAVAVTGQSSSCFACTAGSFADGSGSTYCKKCPENTYSNSTTGYSSCAACPGGTKSSGGASICS